MTILPSLALDLSGNDFLLPYFQRQFPMPDGDEKAAPAVAGIKIVTHETEGARDEEFEAFCQEGALPIAVIRCPYIVGTGMTGLMRRIAAGIYRGTFMHIKGNEARISVVHASDVARAAALAIGSQGTYSLTDGDNPSIAALADAFAYRMNNKRIFAIKPQWARYWYGRRYFNTLTTTHTIPDTFELAFPDFKPNSVVDYLRTHDYNEESL